MPEDYSNGKAAFLPLPGALHATGALALLKDSSIKVETAVTSDGPATVELVLTVYDIVGTELSEFVIATQSIDDTGSFTPLTGQKTSNWGAGAYEVYASLRSSTPGRSLTIDRMQIKDLSATDAASRAVTAAGEASSSRDAAGEHEAEAARYQGLAAAARDEAGDHAFAASQHADTASSYVDEAQAKADAAEQSRLAAETAQGKAEAAEGQAVTSKSDAESAAAAAKNYRDLTVTISRDAAEAAKLNLLKDPKFFDAPSGFTFFGAGNSWQFSRELSSDTKLSDPEVFVMRRTSHDRTEGFNTPASPVFGGTDRYYRIRAKVKISATTGSPDATFYIGAKAQNLGEPGERTYPIILAAPQADWITVDEVVHFADEHTHVSAAFQIFRGNSYTQLHVADMHVGDVTEQMQAKVQAEAAVQHAEDASGYADASGEAAQASQQDRVRAETARSNAESFAQSAASSEQTAFQAASTASQEAGLAVSARNKAEEWAGAAETSSTTASSKATDAETAAGIASTARAEAETARGQAYEARDVAISSRDSAAESASSAETARTLAAEAKDDARGHASTASIKSGEAVSAAQSAIDASSEARTFSEVAAGMTSKGFGVLSDQFLPAGSEGWSHWSGSDGVSIQPNSRYPVGNEYRFTVGTENKGVSIHSLRDVWSGVRKGTSFRVDLEFTRHSGDMDGAGVRFYFITDQGNFAVQKSLREMTPTYTSFPTDEMVLATGEFTLDEGINPDQVQQITVYIMANYGTSFGGATAKDFTVHRFQISPITYIEASIQEARTAIVDLQGNAASGYLIKAQAGGEVSLLELFAADGSGKSASVAKLQADEILLRGSVTLDMLTVMDTSGNMVPNRAWITGELGSLIISDTANVVTPKHNPNHQYREFSEMTSPYALRIIGGDTSILTRELVAVNAGAQVTFSVDAAIGGSPRERTGQIGIRCYDSNGDFLRGYYKGEVLTSPAYTPIEMTRTMEPDVAFVRFWMRAFDGDGVVFFCNPVATKARKAATVVTPNSIHTGLLDVDSLSVAGLSIFGGTLASTDFDGNGNGWRLTRGGTFNAPRASIDTIQLKDGSVGLHWAANSDRITVSLSYPARVMVVCNVRVMGTYSTHTTTFQLLRNGDDVESIAYSVDEFTMPYTNVKTFNLSAGTYTFRMRFINNDNKTDWNSARIAVFGTYR